VVVVQWLDLWLSAPTIQVLFMLTNVTSLKLHHEKNEKDGPSFLTSFD